MDDVDCQARRYAVTVRPDGQGGYLADVPDFPGVIAGGDSPEEALACAYDGIASVIDLLREEGLPIPEPAPEPATAG